MTYLDNQKNYSQVSHFDFDQKSWVYKSEQPPREKVFEFASITANKLKLPFDIRSYIDKAAASRLRKYGFKRALEFIEKRSSAVASAFAVMPETWWKVDNEIKRAKLAVEMAGRCGNRVRLAADKGLSPIETLEFINEFTGASLWLPQFTYVEDDTQAFSAIVRLMDEGFWRRAIGRIVVAVFENARRAAGMVSPHSSPYASISACEWLTIRQDRQREWIELMAIESDNGDIIDLQTVIDSSQSNPANRRHELMTRIAGCQEYAESNDHVAIFITMTSPSRFHRLRQHGKYWVENQHFDGSTPKDAHAWLSKGWELFRAWADYRELTYYGMRVVEPHQDGTPHWHGVFFMPLEQIKTFISGLQLYQFRESKDLYFEDGTPKTKAMKARFDAKFIDKSDGGAVAYLAKYISKNVDGHALEGLTDTDNRRAKLQDTVKNVTAWSRTFCFRQFQFQRTPPVTIWRELRRIDEEQEFCLFEKARRAADNGFFSAYMDYMGGHRLSASMRPIKLLKKERENKYGEIVTSTDGVEGSGLTVLTRETEWKLIKKASDLSEASEGSGSDRPWSSGNNCRIPLKSQKIIDHFFLEMELNRSDPNWEAFVNDEAPPPPLISNLDLRST
ncbi:MULTISPECIES: replication endonuclease [unclassified Vibrio]|uniref:replication endonuclease n=1 Tax=unclassified Vibrio TaxID=2614977 RepID=UPI00136152CC|nr:MULTISPECIES: replication endonuclease [unclassified Vibrio]NAW58746.1 replication endonuclease [Vibrio sp. V36_P2S2PM302]NAX27179.1 replication endonuclease [Vibrio sp. V38_P2S17PM301]NAX31732.1 replication endonuclease [Vibrio sp. V37_P2S8PM304]